MKIIIIHKIYQNTRKLKTPGQMTQSHDNYGKVDLSK